MEENKNEVFEETIIDEKTKGKGLKKTIKPESAFLVIGLFLIITIGGFLMLLRGYTKSGYYANDKINVDLLIEYIKDPHKYDYLIKPIDTPKTDEETDDKYDEYIKWDDEGENDFVEEVSKNTFDIDIPKQFKKYTTYHNNDDVNIVFPSYQYDINNFECEFSFLKLINYSNVDEAINQVLSYGKKYAEFDLSLEFISDHRYEISSINKKKINNLDWQYFTIDHYAILRDGKEYSTSNKSYYITLYNGGVYLFESEIENRHVENYLEISDEDLENVCPGYFEQVLNSIKAH